MKHLGLLLLLVIGCSAQGAEWTDEETEIIAEKLWDIIIRPGRAIKQYLKAHPGYTAIPQGRPTPQKVHSEASETTLYSVANHTLVTISFSVTRDQKLSKK